MLNSVYMDLLFSIYLNIFMLKKTCKKKHGDVSKALDIVRIQ